MRSRQLALADPALDQLLAVWRTGGLVISRIERSLIVIEKYRRSVRSHRRPRSW
jgi:hypothetical protein